MTTSTTSTSSSSTNPYSYLNGTSSTTTVSEAKTQSERFLTLLTTQLKNQDPLNPTSNAEMTSQMAQISTVTGIETLNASITAISSQFVQMQALQGASLVGKNVLLEGNSLSISNGTATGSFEISAAATTASVDILNSAGTVVDTVSLGAQKAGRHEFSWPSGSVTNDSGYTFRVTAKSGDTALTATALMRDTVQAVNTSDSTLTLELARNGAVTYDKVKALE